MSGPDVPLRVSFLSVPPITVTLAVAVAPPPSLAVMVISAFWLFFCGTIVIVSVRLGLLPPKTILLVGTSLVLDEARVKVTPPRGESTSPTVRLMVPLVPLAGARAARGDGDRGRIVDGVDGDADGHGRRLGALGIARLVAEAVGAVVVGGGRIAEGAVGVQRQGAVAGAADEHGRERVAGVRIGVVAEHTRGRQR